MKKRLKLKVLIFCILFTILPACLNTTSATETSLISNEQIQNNLEKPKKDLVTKEEVQVMIQSQMQSLTKEEITQQLIDTQKSRISILEGNYNALLTLLGVIVAVLTLFGGIFVWISRRSFSFKVEEVEKRLSEMKQLKNEVIVKTEVARELNNNLNLAIRETQDLQISLNKIKVSFDKEIERINQIEHYVNFVELKASRSEVISTFVNEVKKSQRMISELNYWVEGTLPNYEFVLTRVTAILGKNVIREGSNESIQEKLSYYIERLEEEENCFWKEVETPLKWVHYENEDKDDFIDPLNDTFEDWKSIYEDIRKVHMIISAQIAMNPGKFSAKVNMDA